MKSIGKQGSEQSSKKGWGIKHSKKTQEVSAIPPNDKRGKEPQTESKIGFFTKLNPVKSVGVKLFLIFFTAIVTFVLVLGCMSYFKAKSTIKQNAANANRQTIIQTSDKLDIILKQFENVALQIFFDPEMQTMVDNLSNSKLSTYDLFVLTSDITKKLSNQINSNGSIRGVYLIQPDNNQRAISAGSVSVELDKLRDQVWYKEALNKNQSFWYPTERTADGTGVFRLVRSLQSLSRGGKAYIVAIELKTEVLEEQLKRVDLGKGGKLQLVSPDGQVVASNVEGQASKKTDFAFMQTLKQSSGSLDSKDVEGKSVVAVYQTLSKTGWKLVGSIPTEVLVKDAKGILLLTLWSTLGVMVIAILIGWWMIRMIARPMSRIKDLMIEGSKGNLNVRTDHKSKDEIGQLATNFNLMMDQITKLVKQTNETAQDVLDTAGELSDASKKTAISAKEIALATEEIANGASSLANEAERGNELTDHISKQMRLVIDANSEMGSAANHVEQSSERGTRHLNDLLDKTHQTEQITRSLMHKVDDLKQTTLSVNKVLEVLQNLTKQTNILSLNATIEAARAGAAGRGFMVVADEIRQLANQSKESIEMVGKITEKIMAEMNETVLALNEAHPLFNHQMNAVKETNDIFVSVQEHMGDFNRHLGSVTESIEALNQSQVTLSEAMGNVSAVAEESSATSEEVASLSNEQQSVGDQLVHLSDKLENVSNELKTTLSRFTI
ncbi:methyl-accepting chemotaxis protein [Paenibacillus pini]|uniref:Methyl-accepting chemotaxis protein n=1 Tax=Paenibacillus pini JCM 16418 TaxID=1236976 RepID=W7YED9_9BACL|nr:methyl-accepting chemotaxis protein [Paenibacillus pini]GAF06852.1 hypothetical protein JCM16418_835 [Paenibacillus pini JCM 16418]